MNYENILVFQEKNSATVTINRPTKLNALNKATILELHEAFKILENNKEIRVIILTGSGDKAFVAGALIVVTTFSIFNPISGMEHNHEIRWVNIQPASVVAVQQGTIVLLVSFPY